VPLVVTREFNGIVDDLHIYNTAQVTVRHVLSLGEARNPPLISP
jgi:hypothetical protein